MKSTCYIFFYGVVLSTNYDKPQYKKNKLSDITTSKHGRIELSVHTNYKESFEFLIHILLNLNNTDNDVCSLSSRCVVAWD